MQTFPAFARIFEAPPSRRGHLDRDHAIAFIERFGFDRLIMYAEQDEFFFGCGWCKPPKVTTTDHPLWQAHLAARKKARRKLNRAAEHREMAPQAFRLIQARPGFDGHIAVRAQHLADLINPPRSIAETITQLITVTVRALSACDRNDFNPYELAVQQERYKNLISDLNNMKEKESHWREAQESIENARRAIAVGEAPKKIRFKPTPLFDKD
jgi:hypothetical protein